VSEKKKKILDQKRVTEDMKGPLRIMLPFGDLWHGEQAVSCDGIIMTLRGWL
jgi:hypothetical protein